MKPGFKQTIRQQQGSNKKGRQFVTYQVRAPAGYLMQIRKLSGFIGQFYTVT
jgi:hypothetical protein